MISKTAFGKLPRRVSSSILVHDVRYNSKAAEAYVDAEFTLSDGSIWDGCVPVNYRNTGLDARNAEEAIAILDASLKAREPVALILWRNEAAAWGIGVVWGFGGLVRQQPQISPLRCEMTKKGLREDKKMGLRDRKESLGAARGQKLGAAG
jgi:hypothetical protein